jgi:tRNA threonylcarbamoyladenosine modification (KEOPS) complex  Pcc1 subunit
MARVKLCLGRAAEALAGSLEAEARQPAPGRGSARVGLSGGCLAIELEAPDATGLIALLNSYMLLAHAAYSAVRGAEATHS